MTTRSRKRGHVRLSILRSFLALRDARRRECFTYDELLSYLSSTGTQLSRSTLQTHCSRMSAEGLLDRKGLCVFSITPKGLARIESGTDDTNYKEMLQEKILQYLSMRNEATLINELVSYLGSEIQEFKRMIAVLPLVLQTMEQKELIRIETQSPDIVLVSKT